MKVDSLGPALVAATAWGAAAGGATQQTAASMITAVIRALAEVERSMEDKDLDLVKHGKHAIMAHGTPKAGCGDFDINSKGVSKVSAQDEHTGKSCQGEHAMTKNGHLLDKFAPAPQGGRQSEVPSYMDAGCILNVCAHGKITGTSSPLLDGTLVPMGTSDMDANGILTISEQERPTQQLQQQQQQNHGESQLLTDGTPASMGFETASGGTTEPFEWNTIFHAVNARTSAMSAVNQPEVLTQACADEHATTKDSNRVGTFLDGTPPAPQSRPQSEVTPSSDAKGISSMSVQDKPTCKSFEHEKAATKNNHLMYEIHADGVSPAPPRQPQSEAASDMDANGILNVPAHDQLTVKPFSKSFEHLTRYVECICEKKTLVPMGTADMDAKGILNISVQEEPTCRPEVTSDRDANGVLNVSLHEKPAGASLPVLDATPPSMGMNTAGGDRANSSKRRRMEEIRATLAGLKALVSQYVAPRQAARVRKLEQQLAALETGNEAP